MFAGTMVPEATDLKGLFLLLDLLANPERAGEAQGLLAKLAALKNETEAKLEAQAKQYADLTKREEALRVVTAAHEKEAVAVDAKLASARVLNSDSSNKLKAVEAALADLAKREEALAHAKAEHESKASNVLISWNERAATVNERMLKAEALKAEYEQKLAKLDNWLNEMRR